jgi:hypothetical protein
MTLKDKANELVEKYNILLSVHIFNGTYDIAKQCAILSVEDLIKESETMTSLDYWQEVKEELKKL